MAFLRQQRASTIERRIRRTVLGAILITFIVTVASVLIANEKLEESLLEMDMQTERDFLLDNARPNEILMWDIATLTAYFVPSGMQADERMPALFRGLPFPFSGEVEVDQSTFLITASKVNSGRLYLAKDISLFETREDEFHRFLLLLGLAVIALGIFLARLTGKRLVSPVQQLARQIRDTKPAPRMQRVDDDYQDAELKTIAQSFNLFLHELETYIKREQSLMGLASHELRTPIAVIAGALDVIERRGGLGHADQGPLLRMRRAVDEMAANIDIILRLTRRKAQSDRREIVRLADLIQDIQGDLTRHLPEVPQRLQLKLAAQPQVQADPVLVKMLLRNLIQNALQHTDAGVEVLLETRYVDIRDHGQGLPEAYRAYLNDPQADASELLSLSGLGLFIVSLIGERLGWTLQVLTDEASGNVLRIGFVPDTAHQGTDHPSTSH